MVAKIMATNGYYVAGQEPNHEENGRWFHGWRKGLYMFPCDEEEMNRMDIFHQLTLVARDNKLHKHPLISNPEGLRVLDVGTGTGIWAIDMADKYRDAEVIGIDLVNIQPETIPPNLRFRIPRDYESMMWNLGENSFDLIHLRCCLGGVSHWPEMYQKVYQHLKPGYGHIEHVEIDYEPRCDDGPTPRIIKQWWDYLADATNRGSKPLQYSPQSVQMLRAQGFVDVEETIIRLPFNTWPDGAQEKNIGRWYNLNMTEGMEALCLGPFTRVYRWPVDDVRRFVKDIKAAICNKQNRVYNTLRIITARKP